MQLSLVSPLWFSGVTYFLYPDQPSISSWEEWLSLLSYFIWEALGIHSIAS